jgi:hypothetical protein
MAEKRGRIVTALCRLRPAYFSIYSLGRLVFSPFLRKAALLEQHRFPGGTSGVLQSKFEFQLPAVIREQSREVERNRFVNFALAPRRCWTGQIQQHDEFARSSHTIPQMGIALLDGKRLQLGPLLFAIQ